MRVFVIVAFASASTAAGPLGPLALLENANGLELTIIDTEARAPGMPATAPSDGHGLIGMRERTAVFGGSLATTLISPVASSTALNPLASTSPTSCSWTSGCR